MSAQRFLEYGEIHFRHENKPIVLSRQHSQDDESHQIFRRFEDQPALLVEITSKYIRLFGRATYRCEFGNKSREVSVIVSPVRYCLYPLRQRHFEEHLTVFAPATAESVEALSAKAQVPDSSTIFAPAPAIGEAVSPLEVSAVASCVDNRPASPAAGTLVCVSILLWASPDALES